MNLKKGEKDATPFNKMPDNIEDLSPLPSPSKKKYFDFSRSPNLKKKEFTNFDSIKE